MAAFKRKLASFGAQQMAVVENSIAEGYQGLVPPKHHATRAGNGHAPPAVRVRTIAELEAQEAQEMAHGQH